MKSIHINLILVAAVIIGAIIGIKIDRPIACAGAGVGVVVGTMFCIGLVSCYRRRDY